MKHHISYCEVYIIVVQIKCDNTNAINLTKNLVLHSLTKTLILDTILLGTKSIIWDWLIEFMSYSNKLEDIFIKHFTKENLFSIRTELGNLNKSCINYSCKCFLSFFFFPFSKLHAWTKCLRCFFFPSFDNAKGGEVYSLRWIKYIVFICDGELITPIFLPIIFYLPSLERFKVVIIKKGEY